MAVAIVTQIGPTLGIVRPEALHAIVDGILPLRLASRNRATDDGRTDADTDRRADIAAAAPPTATPAPASTSTPLRVGRRDAQGAGRGNHPERVHRQQDSCRQHA